MGKVIIVKDSDYSTNNIGQVAIMENKSSIIYKIVDDYVSIVGSVYQKEITELVTTLVVHNLHNKFYAIYPMLGTTDATVCCNMLNPSSRLLVYANNYAGLVENGIKSPLNKDSADTNDTFTYPEFVQEEFDGVRAMPISVYAAYHQSYTSMNVAAYHHDYSTDNKDITLGTLWSNPDIIPFVQFCGLATQKIKSEGYISRDYNVLRSQSAVFRYIDEQTMEYSMYMNGITDTKTVEQNNSLIGSKLKFAPVTTFDWVIITSGTVSSKSFMFAGTMRFLAYGRLSKEENAIAVQAFEKFIEDVKGYTWKK